MRHPHSKSTLFTRRIQADTNQELAMPPGDPRRERMDDPDWDRFDSDDGRLFELRAPLVGSKRSALPAYPASKVARPIDVPPGLSHALTGRVEDLLRTASTRLGSSEAWDIWRGSKAAELTEDIQGELERELPWVIEAVGGRHFMLHVSLQDIDPSEGIACAGHYTPALNLISITLEGLDYSGAQNLPNGVYNQILGVITHELAHVMQEAYCHRAGASHSALEEFKAYSAELADAYASALDDHPNLTVEEFLQHAPDAPEIRSLLGSKGWRRVLKDLGYVSEWHRRINASYRPMPSTRMSADPSGGPCPSQAREVLATLFQRQARIPGTETTITLKVSPGTENALVPMLEDLQTLGDWGCGRDVVIEDFTDEGSKDREKHGDGRHGFDGDGSDYIIDIKVEKGKPKPRRAALFTRTALIQPARGEGVGAPSANRRHLDEDFKEEMEAERDPDLIRHTHGVEASAWRPGK